MSFERAKAALAGTRFADLRWVSETGSTNADVLELLSAPDRGVADDGPGGPSPSGPVVLLADHQTAGRGRRGRTWDAPPGSSLLMTIGLPVADIDEERRTLVNAAVALAVIDAAPDLRVKWPNDLVAVGVGSSGSSGGGDRKVGGILAELHPDVGGRGPWLLIGVGLNVNWGEMPAELADTATSLDLLLGGPVDVDVVVTDLLLALERRWLPLLGPAAGTVDELLDAYRSRSATLGLTVRVELEGEGEELVGTALDIEASGALVVGTADDARRVVTVGDVVHLRPDPPTPPTVL